MQFTHDRFQNTITNSSHPGTHKHFWTGFSASPTKWWNLFSWIWATNISTNMKENCTCLSRLGLRSLWTMPGCHKFWRSLWYDEKKQENNIGKYVYFFERSQPSSQLNMPAECSCLRDTRQEQRDRLLSHPVGSWAVMTHCGLSHCVLKSFTEW